ncbi:segregation and condensation protein A [Hirschia baltica]|uniref:Segregation and condensation protein A n=1 Tax=Hirschia baltica (strain ATCC 49814 / DSM 5838 / IFAM 1418) TaxID=582402 RepID=C6XIZ1_HIRBI|nr:ScpA family protein [Hirschia baltica]ACT59086.1 chromosome segregation and condensation protein ScpA [Hirschia baltica ATCC 49814]
MQLAQDQHLRDASRKVEDAAPEDVFTVDIHGYEGPLHLLLELSRRQKVDLLQVSILQLAEQFLEFILEAKSHRIELAADYLLMASWLAYLKSKLLLPKLDEKSELEPEAGAMARRLSFRIARLEAMRNASTELNALNITGRDVFVRGMPERVRINKKVTYDASIYDLMKAFGNIQSRKTRVRSHIVRRQPVLALESARKSLKKIVPQLDDWARIQGLSAPSGEPDETPRKSITASYFAAALELTRDRAVDMRQDAALSDVYVRRAQAENKAS